MIDPDGGRFTYSFDDLYRIETITNPEDHVTSYVYDDANRPITKSLANGTWTSFTYDAAGQNTNLFHLKSDNSVLSAFTYTYDGTGNRTQVAEDTGDRVTWTYDDTYQLTREQRTGTDAYNVTYTYDPVGNRLTSDDGTIVTSYTYDNANRLETADDGSAVTTYTFDAAGNQRTVEVVAGVTTYGWDFNNQNTSVEKPNGDLFTFTYNGDMVRVMSESPTGDTKFIYDNQNVLLETDDLDVTQVVYTLNPKEFGNLISRYDAIAADSDLYHYDALGSTVALTDSAEVETDTYVYYAFGKIKSSSGTTDQPYQWVGETGYYAEPDLDRYHMRRRDYESGSGRFLSEDPIRDDEENLYRYVWNNAVNDSDPSGLVPPGGLPFDDFMIGGDPFSLRIPEEQEKTQDRNKRNLNNARDRHVFLQNELPRLEKQIDKLNRARAIITHIPRNTMFTTKELYRNAEQRPKSKKQLRLEKQLSVRKQESLNLQEKYGFSPFIKSLGQYDNLTFEEKFEVVLQNAWDKGYFGEEVHKDIEALKKPETALALATGIGVIATAYLISLKTPFGWAVTILGTLLTAGAGAKVAAEIYEIYLEVKGISHESQLNPVSKKVARLLITAAEEGVLAVILSIGTKALGKLPRSKGDATNLDNPLEAPPPATPAVTPQSPPDKLTGEPISIGKAEQIKQSPLDKVPDSGTVAPNSPAPRSLTDIQTRDWYHGRLSEIDNVVEQMRSQGKSLEEIAKEAHQLRNEAKMQARELMQNQELAKSFPPPLTWDEAMKKYNGDYEKIIGKSQSSNKAVDQSIEGRRARGEQ